MKKQVPSSSQKREWWREQEMEESVGKEQEFRSRGQSGRGGGRGGGGRGGGGGGGGLVTINNMQSTSWNIHTHGLPWLWHRGGVVPRDGSGAI